MAVKKIVAANMRRALEIAREQLGDEAIILSTRKHPDGIELIATVETQPGFPDDQQAFAQQKTEVGHASTPLNSDNAWQHQHLVNDAVQQRLASQREAQPESQGHATAFSQLAQTKSSGALFGGRSGNQLALEIEQARERMLAAQQTQATTQAGASVLTSGPKSDVWASQLKPRSAVAANQPERSLDDPHQQEMARLHQELSLMRELLQQRFQEPRLDQPTAFNPLVNKLTEMGLPAFQAERLVAAVNDELMPEKAWPEALAILSQRIPVTGRDIIAKGGLYAFVGPTGVGKTTTLAKLAVRFVVEQGAEGLALVTTDNFRLAAHEQLTTLGQILSVPVKVVSEGESLEQVLMNLSHKKLVLIDTAGLRHGDPRLKAQLEQLRLAGKVNSLLVLAANSQLQMLKASYHAYGAAHPTALILTKLDETPSLGEALGMILQHRLPVAYTTDGQEIPADIQVAKGHQLVAKAAQQLTQARHLAGRKVTADTPLQVQSEHL